MLQDNVVRKHVIRKRYRERDVQHSMHVKYEVIALSARRATVIANDPEAHVSTRDVLAQEQADNLHAWCEGTRKDVCCLLQRGVKRVESRSGVHTEGVWGVLEVQIAEKDPQVAQRCQGLRYSGL